MIQGWDPDYDPRLNNTTNYNNNVTATRKRSNSMTSVCMSETNTENTNDLFLLENNNNPSNYYITILISITNNNNNNNNNVNERFDGWCQREHLQINLKCSINIISNILTYIREFQSLYALKNINKELQKIILTGKSQRILKSNIQTTNSNQFINQINIKTEPIKTEYSIKNEIQSNVNMDVEVEVDEDSLDELSNSMKNSLIKQYNESQLNAIGIIYNKSVKLTSSMTLLQGPPGMMMLTKYFNDFIMKYVS